MTIEEAKDKSMKKLTPEFISGAINLDHPESYKKLQGLPLGQIHKTTWLSKHDKTPEYLRGQVFGIYKRTPSYPNKSAYLGKLQEPINP